MTILLLINQSHLSIAQASSFFKHLDTGNIMYATPTFITDSSVLYCHSSTAAYNDCCSELMAYTALITRPRPSNDIN